MGCHVSTYLVVIDVIRTYLPMYCMHVVIRGSGNFLDAAAREKLLERQTMEAAKRSNDRMEEQIQVSLS